MKFMPAELNKNVEMSQALTNAHTISSEETLCELRTFSWLSFACKDYLNTKNKKRPQSLSCPVNQMKCSLEINVFCVLQRVSASAPYLPQALCLLTAVGCSTVGWSESISQPHGCCYAGLNSWVRLPQLLCPAALSFRLAKLYKPDLTMSCYTSHMWNKS